MRNIPALLAAALVTCCTLLSACGQQAEDAPEPTLADQLNQSNAVIGAGDVYDAVAVIGGADTDVRMMRVYSARGYNIDFPLEQFDYTTAGGSDFFHYIGADGTADGQCFVEISTSHESMDECVQRLTRELSGRFASVGSAAVELNGYTATLVYCESPAPDSGLQADMLLDCFAVHSDDGCRIISVNYTLSSDSAAYQYMTFMLNTFTPTVG